MKRDEQAYRPYSMRWRAALALLILHLVVYAWIFVSAIWRVFALEMLVGGSDRTVSGFESQIGLAML